MCDCEGPVQDPDRWTVEQVDTHVESLIGMIIQCTNNLPHTRTNKHAKTYWNKQLTKLAKDKKVAWKSWVQHGRNRDDDNIHWTTYRAAKKTFRQSQRPSGKMNRDS